METTLLDNVRWTIPWLSLTVSSQNKPVLVQVNARYVESIDQKT